MYVIMRAPFHGFSHSFFFFPNIFNEFSKALFMWDESSFLIEWNRNPHYFIDVKSQDNQEFTKRWLHLFNDIINW